MEMLREFFGFGGYKRAAEGYLSWQHLTFVTVLLAFMCVLAVVLGRRNRRRTEREKNRVLIAAAIAINGFEMVKVVVKCMQHGIEEILYLLPLFVCSVQLIAIPLAAASRGRLKEAALDFVSIFGPSGALLGTYAAGNNYAAYPVLSMDNVISGITHTLAGFAAVYIMVAGMASMKRENVPVTCGIILSFCIPAYVMNRLIDYNYMFLISGDGTPYDILYNLVGGSPVLYPLGVVLLFLLYIGGFYAVYGWIARRVRRAAAVRID